MFWVKRPFSIAGESRIQRAEELSGAEAERSSLRVQNTVDHARQFHRLQREHEGNGGKHPVGAAYQRQHDQAADGIDEQYVSVVETQVEDAEEHHQQHPPGKARPEVYTPVRLVVVLDEETQAEEQREYRVHLSGEQGEHPVPDKVVDLPHEFRRRLGKHVEIHVLDEMDQHDAGNGEAAEHIRDLDSRICLA